MQIDEITMNAGEFPHVILFISVLSAAWHDISFSDTLSFREQRSGC